VNVPPKEKRAPAESALQNLQLRPAYHDWVLEATRLLAEFWRTGNRKHLDAFATHVVAMRAGLFDLIDNARSEK
jgi:hypothetical protein